MGLVAVAVSAFWAGLVSLVVGAPILAIVVLILPPELLLALSDVAVINNRGAPTAPLVEVDTAPMPDARLAEYW